MTVFLLASAGLSHWATTQRRRDAIGLGQQLAAGIAVLVLTAVTGTFAVYAMPGIMLTAVFGFSLTRHPFVGSVGAGRRLLPALPALRARRVGLGSQLPLQVFVVAATVVCGCVGAYLLERSQRTAFAQGRLVSALHERVDQLLHQYLSPDVASALIEDPGRAALGGEEVEVTVLFADLRGYTAFAERRPPAEVVAMLNAAFGVAVPIVLAEGGTVVQFMGDAMMAIFNAPNPQPDHALRAARAALAMQRGMAELPGADAAAAVPGRPQQRSCTGRQHRRRGDAQLLGDRRHDQPRSAPPDLAPEGSVVIGASTYDLIRRPGDRSAAGVAAPQGQVAAGRGLRAVGPTRRSWRRIRHGVTWSAHRLEALGPSPIGCVSPWRDGVGKAGRFGPELG